MNLSKYIRERCESLYVKEDASLSVNESCRKALGSLQTGAVELQQMLSDNITHNLNILGNLGFNRVLLSQIRDIDRDIHNQLDEVIRTAKRWEVKELA
jgi:hypothetical protein